MLSIHLICLVMRNAVCMVFHSGFLFLFQNCFPVDSAAVHVGIIHRVFFGFFQTLECAEKSAEIVNITIRKRDPVIICQLWWEMIFFSVKLCTFLSADGMIVPRTDDIIVILTEKNIRFYLCITVKQHRTDFLVLIQN